MYYRNCNCYHNENNNNSCDNNNKCEKIENICNCINNNSYNDPEDCACGFDEEESGFPDNPVYGQSYVPIQIMDKTFVPKVGLKMGTLFPELVSPYVPCQSMREIDYLEATNPIKGGCSNG